MARRSTGKKSGKDISPHEIRDIEDRSRPRARVIYEIVRVEGEVELARPVVSLWWSGLAAGLSISFSLLAQSILYAHLPDTPWRHLISSLGYSVGFLMVVLSRQQLFTESTITVVLPLLAQFSRGSLAATARMWAIVLAANILGTFFAAAFCSFAPVLPDGLLPTMLELSRAAMAHGWWEMLFRGISAGFLIAAMVWLIPSAQGAEFHIVVVMTYLIAVGSFSHIVAGSVEAFLLLLGGQTTVGEMVWGFMTPTLIGNVIGGTVLFAMISYAQVMEEM